MLRVCGHCRWLTRYRWCPNCERDSGTGRLRFPVLETIVESAPAHREAPVEPTSTRRGFGGMLAAFANCFRMPVFIRRRFQRVHGG